MSTIESNSQKDGRLTPELHLPAASRRNILLPPYRRLQWRAVVEAPQVVQDLGYPVVRKHGDLVNIPELSVVLALKAGPQISNKDLGSFASPFKDVLIAEAVEVPRQQVDQAGSGPVGRGDQVYWVAAVFLGGMSDPAGG